MKKNKMTQNERILSALSRGSFSTAKAKSRNIQNLRARICELRDEGANIVTVMARTRNGELRSTYELRS